MSEKYYYVTYDDGKKGTLSQKEVGLGLLDGKVGAEITDDIEKSLANIARIKREMINAMADHIMLYGEKSLDNLKHD